MFGFKEKVSLRLIYPKKLMKNELLNQWQKGLTVQYFFLKYYFITKKFQYKFKAILILIV